MRSTTNRTFTFIASAIGICLCALFAATVAPTLDNIACAAGTYDTGLYQLHNGNYAFSAFLLDDATSTASGDWIEVRGLGSGSIQTIGITTATVQIRGSNSPITPEGDGVQIGSNITADGLTALTTRTRWIKAMCSSYTSGTIKVILFGHGE
jgi:hypothetical protein